MSEARWHSFANNYGQWLTPMKLTSARSAVSYNFGSETRTLMPEGEFEEWAGAMDGYESSPRGTIRVFVFNLSRDRAVIVKH